MKSLGRPGRAAVVESLEDRKLLSASLINGVLTVTGTDRYDYVCISRSAKHITNIVVTEKLSGRGATYTTFKTSSVLSISVNLLGGNDYFKIDDSGTIVTQARSINGGVGNDTLIGGVGDDLLNGYRGADSLVGLAGNDTLYGGGESDSLYGGDGDDALYGGDGPDYAFDTVGTNVIDMGFGADFINNVSEPVPPVPTNFTAVAATPTAIDLAWTDVVNEESYLLQRSPDDATGWTGIATLGVNVTSYRDSGLTAGATYYYRLSSGNSSGNSAPTATANATL